MSGPGWVRLLLKRVAILATISLHSGCGLTARDLLSEGVYRLDATRVGGARATITATELDGRLLVDGRLTGGRYETLLAEQVEVVLACPDGTTLAAGRSDLHHAHYSRASRAHSYFHVWFDRVPPPGTVIRVCPLSSEMARRDGCGRPPASKGD